MREESRKRLYRLLRLDVSTWFPAIAMVALFGAGVVAYYASAGRERHVAATVESAAWRLNNETGHVYPFIQAKLDGGSSVRIGETAPALPGVGDRIMVLKRARFFDYFTTYEWEGPGASQPADAIVTPDPATPGPTPVSLH